MTSIIGSERSDGQDRVSKHSPLRFEIVPADEDAAEGEEGLMDIVASFVPDGEAAIAMEPRVRAFDDPARDAQAAAMRRPPTREDRDDALGVQTIAMGLGVVAPVPLENVRAAAGPATPAADRGQGSDERVELGDVVDIGRRHLCDERDTARVGDEMMLGARLAAIGWVRSSFFPHGRRGPTSYRPRSTAGRGGHGGGGRRAGSRAAAARPRYVATAPAGASRCSRSHSPSAVAASATECPSAGRTRCRSEWRGLESACGRADARV
jgi:hypothetical protein